MNPASVAPAPPEGRNFGATRPFQRLASAPDASRPAQTTALTALNEQQRLRQGAERIPLNEEWDTYTAVDGVAHTDLVGHSPAFHTEESFRLPVAQAPSDTCVPTLAARPAAAPPPSVAETLRHTTAVLQTPAGRADPHPSLLSKPGPTPFADHDIDRRASSSALPGRRLEAFAEQQCDDLWPYAQQTVKASDIRLAALQASYLQDSSSSDWSHQENTATPPATATPALVPATEPFETIHDIDFAISALAQQKSQLQQTELQAQRKTRLQQLAAEHEGRVQQQDFAHQLTGVDAPNSPAASTHFPVTTCGMPSPAATSASHTAIAHGTRVDTLSCVLLNAPALTSYPSQSIDLPLPAAPSSALFIQQHDRVTTVSGELYATATAVETFGARTTAAVAAEAAVAGQCDALWTRIQGVNVARSHRSVALHDPAPVGSPPSPSSGDPAHPLLLDMATLAIDPDPAPPDDPTSLEGQVQAFWNWQSRLYPYSTGDHAKRAAIAPRPGKRETPFVDLRSPSTPDSTTRTIPALTPPQPSLLCRPTSVDDTPRVLIQR